jgi:phage replication O-like protein O
MVADFPQPPAQDDVGEPARAIEPYTQVRNALFDARRHLNLAAQSVALTVERYTVGYHRESAVITLPQFAAESGISREGAKIALKELLAKRIIAQDKTGAGRGTVAAYRILPRSCWLIPESIGQLSVPISTQVMGN